MMGWAPATLQAAKLVYQAGLSRHPPRSAMAPGAEPQQPASRRQRHSTQSGGRQQHPPRPISSASTPPVPRAYCLHARTQPSCTVQQESGGYPRGPFCCQRGGRTAAGSLSALLPQQGTRLRLACPLATPNKELPTLATTTASNTDTATPPRRPTA